MIIFAIILYFLFVVLLGASALLYLSPILIGFVILCIANGMSKAGRGKFAPILWDIATVVVTIYSTSMLWKDINSEAVDTGATPFIVLVFYGLFSLIFIAALNAFSQKKKSDDYTPITPKVVTKSSSASPKKIIAAQRTYVSEPTTPKSRLARVRQNLTVEKDVFQRYGMTFKYNLIEEYDTLQLNFELSNTKTLASKIEKDGELTIKANVYDGRGNLLCIEEVWVEYSQLRRGYAADYFYFSSENMFKANSMKVYAVDPTEDYDEFDEDIDLDDEIEVPEEVAEIVSNEYRQFFDGEPPKEFVQSVYGEYQGWNDDLKKGLRKSTSNPSKKEYDWKLKETWEDYPTPNYNDKHTYCQVAFDESGKSFYYRTRNPELKIGDEVYVPVGYKYQKRVGTIVSMEDYIGKDAPYPLEKTKFIIGKVE